MKYYFFIVQMHQSFEPSQHPQWNICKKSTGSKTSDGQFRSLQATHRAAWLRRLYGKLWKRARTKIHPRSKTIDLWRSSSRSFGRDAFVHGANELQYRHFKRDKCISSMFEKQFVRRSRSAHVQLCFSGPGVVDQRMYNCASYVQLYMYNCALYVQLYFAGPGVI